MSYPGFDDKWLDSLVAKLRGPNGRPITWDGKKHAIVEQPVKPSKYRNVKTVTTDGVCCDSKKEAARWETLKLMHTHGGIRDLLPHPSFPLYVNGTRTGRMTFDALYTRDGQLICEDTKSAITAKATSYRQRLKVFQACYPHITVREHIG